MGNKNTKPVGSFHDWEKVQTQNQINIYRNVKNNQLAQKRTITIDPHFDFDDQLRIYHMRQNNNDSLVKAFGAQEVHKKGHSEGICSGHKKIEVLTEKIPFRLLDLPQLTFPQSLLFLRQSLRAYFRVFKSYGAIHVTKRLIGINNYGQVKCWVNENWALNHPNHELPTLQSTKLQSLSYKKGGQQGMNSQLYDARYRDETEMVHNIVAVIEQKCEQGKYPKAFSEQVQNHSSSFKKLTLYLQDFIRINELFIPPKINYQTVFISKYQTRKIQQQKTGQMSTNQNINQSEFQNQRNSTLGTINSTYLQKEILQAGQAGGQSSNQINAQTQGQQQSIGGGYTVTKNTSTTLGNTISSGNTFASLYQPKPISYQGLNISSGSDLNKNIKANWQTSQSIYKPIQNQSNYSSSYYQYSATNPSSTYTSNYKFGGISSGAENNSACKPSLHTNLNNEFSGDSAYNYLSSNNKKTFSIGQHKFGTLQNSITPQKQKQSYEQFKKNFGQPTNEINTYSYTTSYKKQNKLEPLNLQSGEKGSTYSFDGKNDITTKFAQYSGKGYTNTLNTFQRTSNNNNVLIQNNGNKVDGKYAQQFNNLLGPLLNMKNQYDKDKNVNISNQGLKMQQNGTLQHA